MVGYAWATENSREFREVFVKQRSVDRVLGELAQNLDHNCNRQIAIQGGASGWDVEAFESAARDVRLSKKRFWRAVKLAKRYGYNVSKSYKDYLPKPSADLAAEDGADYGIGAPG